MVATVGSIEVAFAADLKRYEAALRQGEKKTNDFERNAGKSVQGVGAQFVRMGGLARAGIAGLAAGVATIGVTGIVRGFNDVAKSVAEVGDQAKLAGLSVRTFSEWRAVAMAVRIPVDAMADAFKELAIRADEFATTGRGSAADAFGRIGLSRDEVKERLKDPAELMLTIIERTKQLGDTAAGIRIFDEIMGGQGGEQYVRLIEQGEAGVRDIITQAHELGAVMDERWVKRAAEFDQRMNEIANAVGVNLKSAIVSAADSLAEFLDGFRQLENQRNQTLANRSTEIDRERLRIENEILRIRGEQADLTANAVELGFGIDSASVKQEIGALETEMARLNAEGERIGQILSSRTEAMTRTADRTWTPIDTGGDKGRDKAAAAAAREADRVRELIAELEHEKSLIGATALEQDIANTLRQAGASATADQKAQIIGLITALHAEAEAQRQRAEATQLYGDIAHGVMSDLRSALDDGKVTWEEFGGVAINVLEAVTDRPKAGVLESLINGA